MCLNDENQHLQSNTMSSEEQELPFINPAALHLEKLKRIMYYTSLRGAGQRKANKWKTEKHSQNLLITFLISSKTATTATAPLALLLLEIYAT